MHLLKAMMMPVARTKMYETMDAQSSIPHWRRTRRRT